MWNPFRKQSAHATRLASVTVNIPWVGNATFVPDLSEINAAWAIYVEIVTRVPTQPISYGSLREALDSVYEMFVATRAILRESGPRIAHGSDSLAPMALTVLNTGMRPFLSEWHLRLHSHEMSQPPHLDMLRHEQNWPDRAEFTAALDELKGNLDTYAEELLKIAGAEIGGTGNA